MLKTINLCNNEIMEIDEEAFCNLYSDVSISIYINLSKNKITSFNNILLSHPQIAEINLANNEIINLDNVGINIS